MLTVKVITLDAYWLAFTPTFTILRTGEHIAMRKQRYLAVNHPSLFKDQEMAFHAALPVLRIKSER